MGLEGVAQYWIRCGKGCCPLGRCWHGGCWQVGQAPWHWSSGIGGEKSGWGCGPIQSIGFRNVGRGGSQKESATNARRNQWDLSIGPGADASGGVSHVEKGSKFGGLLATEEEGFS